MFPQVLVVHAAKEARDAMASALHGLGYAAAALNSAQRACELLADASQDQIKLVIACASDAEALSRLAEAVATARAAPILIVIAQNGDEADAALRLGAADALIPPVLASRLSAAVANADAIHSLRRRLARLRPEQRGATIGELTGVSPAMRRACELARKAATLRTPVLLEGEAGVGKRLLARALHAESGAQGPFVDVDCENARKNPRDVENALRRAAGGTVYFHDIADADEALQTLLLRLISAAEAGAARIVCATSKDLIARVRSGAFRQELFYALTISPITLPALRNRTEDIPALAREFLIAANLEQNGRASRIGEDALRLLRSYPWPGNVRQLEAAMFRAAALADGPTLSPREFPQIAKHTRGFSIDIPPAPPLRERPRHEGPAMLGASASPPGGLRATANGVGVGIPALNENGEVRSLTAIEADIIRLALKHYRGHMTEIARRLGIGRSTLYRKIREFGLAQGA
ncbi:MAG: sigma 54-interacting transcriptional regulator [Hyphomicrobiales bacterium]|nr:sigma 54-interacting transcriptional regulator [Hyphomicrobiales bacterium]